MHFLWVVQLGRLIEILLTNSALTKIEIVLPAAKVALSEKVAWTCTSCGRGCDTWL